MKAPLPLPPLGARIQREHFASIHESLLELQERVEAGPRPEVTALVATAAVAAASTRPFTRRDLFFGWLRGKR